MTNLLKEYHIGDWCKRGAWIILIFGILEIVAGIYTTIQQASVSGGAPYWGQGLGIRMPMDKTLIEKYTLSMKQTMLLKLIPTGPQHQALLETMYPFNEACTSVASIAFAKKTANKFALQKLVYGELR